MNRTRKLVALMLAVLLLLATLPAAGLADSYKVQPLKLNQWYSLRDYSSSMTIYKLKVTGDTIVNINWKNIKTNSNYAYLSINRDKSCDDTIASSGIYDTSSGTLGFVLYSGTYYIRMYDGKESGKVKFSTKKAATVNKPNYCMGKAITVKAGKKVEIAQTKRDNYHRWYRIKLPNTQTITFSGLRQYNFTLYDRNLNEISCSNRGDVCVTEGLQPKGTYYLEVDRASLYELAQKGKYTAFSWK